MSVNTDNQTVKKPGTNIDFNKTETVKTNKETIAVKIGFDNIVYRATFLKGTLTYLDKVKTFKTHMQELESAKSTKGRIQRAVVTLVVVGIIVAAVSAMVLGGPIGLITAGIGLWAFTHAVDFVLRKLVLDNPSKFNILAPITMPYYLVRYLTTYESKCAEKTDAADKELSAIAHFIVEKHSKIEEWLKSIENKIIDSRKQTNINIIEQHLSLRTIENTLSKLNASKDSILESRKVQENANS